MSGPRSVLTVGFIALDAVRHEGAVVHHAGGTAANVAANLSTIGWNASTAGLIGQDGPGRLIVRDLQTAGVSTDSIELAAEIDTPVVIEDLARGRHKFRFTCPDCGRRGGRSRPPQATEIEAIIQRIPNADVFFFDRVSPTALDLVAALREAGALIVFEPSSGGRETQRAEALGLADVVKISTDALPMLHEEILRARAGQLQIVTDAARGLRWRLGRDRWREQAAYSVKLVDSCGAGDWLTTGLIDQLPTDRGRWNTGTLDRAIAFGQALAAHSCTRVGAAGLRSARPSRPGRGACPVCAR